MWSPSLAAHDRSGGRSTSSEGLDPASLHDLVPMRSAVSPSGGFKVLQHDGEHRSLVRIGAAQKLLLDLARELLAKQAAASLRQFAAVIIQRLQDLLKLPPPAIDPAALRRQVANEAMIASEESDCFHLRADPFRARENRNSTRPIAPPASAKDKSLEPIKQWLL